MNQARKVLRKKRRFKRKWDPKDWDLFRTFLDTMTKQRSNKRKKANKVARKERRRQRKVGK